MTPLTPKEILKLPKLSREFYSKEDTAMLARELLGTYLVHQGAVGVRIGRIVEVEAYLGVHDRAAHSHRGRTPRTEVMFGPPGIAYVYLIYGIHCCMNVVTGPPGQASAILLRGLEPVAGLEGRSNGPGLLTRAIGIDRRHNGLDLLGDELFLIAAASDKAVRKIVARPRIGVDYAGAWAKRLLRFYVRDSPFVSRP